MRFLILSMLWLMSFVGQGQAEPFRLQHPAVSTILGLSLDTFVDTEGRWTAETIETLPASLWTRSQDETPNFGYIKEPVWIRLALENASQEEDWILSFPDVSFVQIAIWKKATNGLDHLTTMNRNEGVAGRPIPKRYFNVPLKLDPGERLELFMRLTFETTSSVPITLEGRRSFEANYDRDTILQSLYFGIMLSMFFYNAFLYISTYDRSYLYYICYVLSLSLMLFWIRDWFSMLHPPAFVLTARTCNSFAYGVLFFGVQFVINLIQDQIPAWLKLTLCTVRNLCLPCLAALYLYDHSTFNQMALIGLAIPLLATSVLAIVLAFIRQRNRQNFSLLLAWSCVILGGLLFSMNRNGFLPQTVLFDYSVQVGSALEVLLLSFSLGDKINEEKRQKLLAQQQIQASEELAQQARAVQDSLIHGQREIPGVTMASFYQSADTTGGDWYAVFHDAKVQRLYVFMGDVTGHGIPSALVTAAVSGSIQSLVENGLSPSLDRDQALERIAKAVNRVVCLTGEKTDRLMTMAFLAVDLDSMQGSFLNAGHHPPFLVQAEGIKPLVCRGNILGMQANPEFEIKQFQLKPGTSLFLYTDGLFDNEGPGGEHYREKRLFTALNPSLHDPHRVMATIVSELKQSWQKGKISDDCALLLLHFHGREARVA